MGTAMKKTIECLKAISMEELKSPISEDTQNKINEFIQQYMNDLSELPKVGFDANLNADKLLCALYEATELNGEICKGVKEKIDAITGFLSEKISSGSIAHGLSELYSAVETVEKKTQTDMQNEINAFKTHLEANKIIASIPSNDTLTSSQLNAIPECDKSDILRLDETDRKKVRSLLSQFNGVNSNNAIEQLSIFKKMQKEQFPASTLDEIIQKIKCYDDPDKSTLKIMIFIEKLAPKLIDELKINNKTCLKKLDVIINEEFAKIDKQFQSFYQDPNTGKLSPRLLSGAVNIKVPIKLRQICSSYQAIQELEGALKKEGTSVDKLLAFQTKFNEPKIKQALNTNTDSTVKQFFKKVKQVLFTALTLGLLPKPSSGSNQQILAKQALASLREADKEGLVQKPSIK